MVATGKVNGGNDHTSGGKEIKIKINFTYRHNFMLHSYWDLDANLCPISECYGVRDLTWHVRGFGEGGTYGLSWSKRVS